MLAFVFRCFPLALNTKERHLGIANFALDSTVFSTAQESGKAMLPRGRLRDFTGAACSWLDSASLCAGALEWALVRMLQLCYNLTRR
jgi:hypothetical protein